MNVNVPQLSLNCFTKVHMYLDQRNDGAYFALFRSKWCAQCAPYSEIAAKLIVGVSCMGKLVGLRWKNSHKSRE